MTTFFPLFRRHHLASPPSAPALVTELTASRSRRSSSPRRLSSEEKGKGKALPETPASESLARHSVEDPSPPGRTTRDLKSSSSSPPRPRSMFDVLSSSPQPIARPATGAAASSANRSPERSPPLRNRGPPADRDLKALVSEGPSRGASIVVTPSSPLLDPRQDSPDVSDHSPDVNDLFKPPTTNSSSSSSQMAATNPGDGVSDDATLLPLSSFTLSSSPTTTSRALERKLSQISLGKGFPQDFLSEEAPSADLFKVDPKTKKLPPDPGRMHRPVYRAKSAAALDDTHVPSSFDRPNVPHSQSNEPPPQSEAHQRLAFSAPDGKRTASAEVPGLARRRDDNWHRRIKRTASAGILGKAERDRFRRESLAVSPPMPSPSLSPRILTPSSSSGSTPSGGKRLSLWGRRSKTDRTVSAESNSTLGSVIFQASASGPGAQSASPLTDDFSLPTFELARRGFPFSDHLEMTTPGSEHGAHTEFLTDSPVTETVLGREVRPEDGLLGLGLVDAGPGLDDGPFDYVDSGPSTPSIPSRSSSTADTPGSMAKAIYPRPSLASSPNGSIGGVTSLEPLNEHVQTWSSSLPLESITPNSWQSSLSSRPSQATSSSSSSTSSSLRRPALFPMRSNSSSSTGTTATRLMDSVFGPRPSTGRVRSSSTLLTTRSKATNDSLFGLTDGLTLPADRTTHQLLPPVSISNEGLPASSYQSGSPALVASLSQHRRPRSATSPMPPLERGSLAPSTASSPSRRPGSIRRLSSGLFVSPSPNTNSSNLFGLRRSNSDKAEESLFPLPSRMSSSSSVAMLSPAGGNGSRSPSLRRESMASSTGSATGGFERERKSAQIEAPTREDDETPGDWLARLLEVVPRYEVANVLAVRCVWARNSSSWFSFCVIS